MATKSAVGGFAALAFVFGAYVASHQAAASAAEPAAPVQQQAACSPAAPPCPASASPPPAGVNAAWWSDNRWRYADDSAATAAYKRLLSSESPWPEWHQVHVAPLPVGLRFQMALSPDQPTDKPGAFGTFDPIPNVRFVRERLAVKVAWKPQIDRVATFVIIEPIPADTGVVGPQIEEKAGAYLPGGGSQLEMKVPASARMRHLKLVEVRPIG